MGCDRAAELSDAGARELIVEKTGTAGFLVPQLEGSGVRLELVSRHFYADACSALDAAISAGQIRHSCRCGAQRGGGRSPLVRAR